ncbi:MAG: formimidoylglutamate deiminase [Pikeienuella sp.]
MVGNQAESVILAKHALTADGWRDDVAVAIGGQGRIASVTANDPRAASSNTVLLPALANLHSHSFQRAMAGMTEHRFEGRDSFWSWRTLMYRFLDKMNPDQQEAVAALTFMEMQEAGYASVGEFHYVHHQPGGAAYDRLSETSDHICAAAAETGIGLTHLPVLYSFGGAGKQDLAGGQLRFGNTPDQFAALHEQATQSVRAVNSDAAIGIAPHSLRATCPEHLTKAAIDYASGPVHIHISEQTKEVEEIEAWLGARPVEWLLENTQVGKNWCLIHATHMTEAETIGTAKAGAVAGLCPITEGNLGDGIFDGVRFIGAGGAYGIGSDSNVRITLAEELRTLEYSQRLRDRSRNAMLTGEGSTGEALYTTAATGGAQAMGRPSGAIRVGDWADLTALDLNARPFWGLSRNQLMDGWIFAGDDAVVSDVWSAGRHMVQNGVHIGRDAILARFRKVMAELTGAL